MAQQPSVFISYSHKDEKWRDLFVRHLGVLERENRLSVWSDRRIDAGGDWYREIEQALTEARVAVLLISADFLTSGFILSEEVPRLLRRREQEGLHLVPVIVKSCAWRNVRWLQPMLARPQNGKALASFRGDKRDAAVVEIAEEIVRFLGEEEGGGHLKDFLAAYRRAFSSLYSRWDLGSVGVAQSRGAGEPIVADLDHMYLPLRLGEGYDIRKTDSGAVLSPTDLLKRNRALVIRGAAGSGKTTWMRWTFRRLLDPALDALPVMVVLRDLAARWRDRSLQGAARSLDAFLEASVAQHLPGWEGHLTRQLEADGPHPVLLVDGWDEVGPLGEELRQKLLGFLVRHRHILAVVTSRPYGEGRPSYSEGFDLLDIQPLSDEEIGLLAGRFFTRCHGADEGAGRRDAERFQRSLERAPEPQALARTALLLTMMLLIARSKPLPDKRHLLYEECIKNLLTALPDRKQEEGALTLPEQWRPTDSEERMRVVAALAYRLKAGDRRLSWQRVSAIVCSWDEMAAILPEHWPLSQRKDFLAWLAGSAGLLTDRADGTLSFTHLSFQEYLAAWHLDATCEGAERVTAFRERLGATDWWETLRLWAAFLHRQSPARLEPVLAALDEAEDGGLALAGCLFADDLGNEEQFEAWLARLNKELAPSSGP